MSRGVLAGSGGTEGLMTLSRCDVWGRAAIADDMLTAISDEHLRRKESPIEVTWVRPDKLIVVRDEHSQRK